MSNSPFRSASIRLDTKKENFSEEFQVDLVLFDNLKTSSTYRSSFSNFVNTFQLNLKDLGHTNSDDYYDKLQDIVKLNNCVAISITNTLSDIYTQDKTIICCPNPNKYLKNGNDNIFFAGYQRHLFDISNDENKSMALGQLAENLSSIEPIIRNSESVIIDLNCIKASELMIENQHPCGINILQACKIARYAGFSDKLKHFQILQPEMTNQIQNNTTALLVWYFLEGREQYLKDSRRKERTTSYILSNEEIGMDLEFIKDEVTFKWWLKDPTETSRLIPCNQSDYDRIMSGEDPMYLLDLIELS